MGPQLLTGSSWLGRCVWCELQCVLICRNTPTLTNINTNTTQLEYNKTITRNNNTHQQQQQQSHKLQSQQQNSDCVALIMRIMTMRCYWRDGDYIMNTDDDDVTNGTMCM